MVSISEPYWQLLLMPQPIRIRVRGSSMYPFLKNGDILEVVRELPPRKGDIIVFRRHRLLVVHRVTKLLDNGVIAGGDGMGPGDLVKESDILGRVVNVLRNERSRNSNSLFSRTYYKFLPYSRIALRAGNKLSGYLDALRDAR